MLFSVMFQCRSRHFASAAKSPYSPMSQSKAWVRTRIVNKSHQVADRRAKSQNGDLMLLTQRGVLGAKHFD
jgi:hypothetical protein